MPLKIDPDVKEVARFWGLDPELMQAVVNAEGPGNAIVKAVQCSIPSVKTRSEALRVLARSCVNRMDDFIVKQKLGKEFVEFWAERWAPRGVSNDPTDLNKNWPVNVNKFWGHD